MLGITEAVSNFALQTSFEVLPAPVVKKTKLTKKVRVETHPDTAAALTDSAKNGKLLGFFGSTIEITAGGSKYAAEIINCKGPGKNQTSEEEMVAKFKNNTSYSANKGSKIEEVIEMVADLEKVFNFTDLTSLLSIND